MTTNNLFLMMAIVFFLPFVYGVAFREFILEGIGIFLRAISLAFLLCC